MARGSSSRSRNGQRVPPQNATPTPSPGVLPVSKPAIPLASLTYYAELARTKAHLQWMRETEDRRQWHPSKHRPARTAVGTSATLRRRFSVRHHVNTALAGTTLGRAYLDARSIMQEFNVPHRVMICIRRKMRKQVMIALRRKGGAGGKRRFNEYSRVKC